MNMRFASLGPPGGDSLRFGGRVAAQSELPVALADGHLYVVEGAGTISRLTSWPEGATVTLYFLSAPTLVHSSNLLLPGAANLTTAAGYAAQVVSLGDGVWRWTGALPASGGPPVESVTGAALRVAADAAAGRTAISALGGALGSTDNAALRADGTGGATAQGSPLIIADTTGALSRSGNGGIPVQGTNTNDDAAPGYIGEYISITVARGSATAISSGSPQTPTGLTFDLTAGDWDVGGVLCFLGNASTTVQYIEGSIGTAANTRNTTVGAEATIAYSAAGQTVFGAFDVMLTLPVQRMKLSATTSIFASGQSAFGVSTASVYGFMWARRRR